MTTKKIDYNLADLIIDGLKNTATELEELRLQMVLGKVEAKDVLEDVKKKLHDRIEEVKWMLTQLQNSKAEITLINALGHLQVQLLLGKADTREAFEKQRDHIDSLLHDLEKKLRSAIPPEQLARLQIDIERFKAKLQLLALTYKLKKLNLEYRVNKGKAELADKLSEIKTELVHKEEQLKTKWQDTKKHIQKRFHELGILLLPID